MSVLAPERAYQKLGTSQVPSERHFRELCSNGLYCFENVDKLNRKGTGNKAAILVITGNMVLLCTRKGILMRSLMLRDVEKVMYAQESNGVKTAIIPFRHVRDPAMMVLLSGANPFHPLKVLSYVRQVHNEEPLKEEKVGVASLQRLASQISFERPTDYMKPTWVERKLSVESARRPSMPPAASPILPVNNPSAAVMPRTFKIVLPDSSTSVGLSFSVAGGVVKTTACEPGSPASKAELGPGYIVTKINNSPISTYEDVTSAITSAKAMAFAPPITIFMDAYNPDWANEPDKVQSSASLLPPNDHANKAIEEREREVAEKERELAEREEKLAVAREAEEAAASELLSADKVYPKDTLKNITTFTFPSPAVMPSESSNFEESDEGEPINHAIDRQMNMRSGPAILPPPQKISFEVDDQMVEFIPEGQGIGEYLNGVKMGVATMFVWDPTTRLLHDQRGHGGTVPKDARLLEKIAAFCDVNNVPLDIQGEGFTVQYSTHSGDNLRYCADLGRLGEYVNGNKIGYATELVYDEFDGTVTNQAGSGGQLPEANKMELLQKIAKLCDACDVPHNIETEAMLLKEAQQRELQALRKTNAELKKQYMIELEKENCAIESKEVTRMENEKLREETETKAKQLEDLEKQLKDREQALSDREKRAEDVKNSAASLYKKLHNQLRDSTAIPEDEVVDTIENIKNNFHWYDVCAYFQEDGGDLSTELRGLSEPTVRRIEKVLEEKGLRLRKASKRADRKQTLDTKQMAPGQKMQGRAAPSSFYPMRDEGVSEFADESQWAVSVPSPHGQPTFRRTLTPTVPPYPMAAQVSQAPLRQSWNPNPANLSNPVFNNTPAAPAPTPQYAAAPPPQMLPTPRYIPEAVAPTFTSPEVQGGLDTMVPNLTKGSASTDWTETIKQLEEAHDRLKMSASPQRAHDDEVEKKLNLLRGGPVHAMHDDVLIDSSDAAYSASSGLSVTKHPTLKHKSGDVAWDML